ncbi:MAG: hypothetical protein JO078_02340 [Candidatus Eremiobacteraeota bacterium]|nr:hypothetical protein [Candidatus Eremiobacteraeota bacterium]MBV9055613.1 hypothetical protein [Candidatus Eremiobacteraeota bacterium]MBV9698942.1 hypothetical protein [Candidatus Eremiobacteraeota bacterium]
MRSSVVGAALAALFVAASAPAYAIPIFAQRYHLRCGQCHSVLPELNAFGNYFRSHGYRLPLPEHGTTIFAMRYQVEYDEHPAAGARQWQPGGIVLGSGNIGPITAFVHYSLGAAGGPGGTFLAFAAGYNARTQTLYRGGLFELPLAQSPGQRLDDLQQYGYYGAHVGLNNLPLSSPRWGLMAERTFGNLTADVTMAFGSYQGAAYGGKPVPTGEFTWNKQPEVGVWLRQKLVESRTSELDVGGTALGGTLGVLPTGRLPFADLYTRYGLLAHVRYGDLDLQAEQWYGDDHDADGFLTNQHSSGGYVRLKYYPIPHAYLGIRYDAYANPFITRDVVYYGAVQIAPCRVLLQEVQPPGQHPFLSGAFTIAFPGPLKY